MKVKKVPLRKCIATNEQHPKMDMIRIVRTPNNDVVIDLKGKEKGHGAYVCKKKSAIEILEKKRLLNKHLEIEVPQDIFVELYKLVENEK